MIKPTLRRTGQWATYQTRLRKINGILASTVSKKYLIYLLSPCNFK